LVPIQYDTAQWQKSFTRFIVEMRIAQRNALDLEAFFSSSDSSSGRRAS
jgi:hypothetical protein